MAAWINPSVADFKVRFYRDFPFGTDPALAVLDQDIAQAFLETNASLNPYLFADQESYFQAYLFLTAHYLVVNIQASSQGLAAQFNFNQTGKSVGSVSESFSIPPGIANDPNFAALCKTPYGARYVLMVHPRTKGIMFTVRGRTKP